jgi:hypothetical protein
MPTGPWPNAPSDKCLPVSILVLRNALVLPIHVHLRDKSLDRKLEIHVSGKRVYQASEMTFVLPAIHPESISSAEITSYKPTYRDLMLRTLNLW